jgi:uncharacterized protein YndB with AHSA1/START domain
MPTGEVVVTTMVSQPPRVAFAAFTEEIDRWWQRPAGSGTIVRFEEERLVAVSSAGAEVLAMVIAWNPPHRFELQWNGPYSQAGDTVTVGFEPEGAGTRVTVTHRRDGLRPEDAVAAVLGFWWGDILRRLAAADRTGSARWGIGG